MKVRVLYNDDKSVSVIHPAPKSKREGETEEEWLERVFSMSTPDSSDYDDIEDKDLPSRDNRGKWKGEKGKGIYLE